jgi:hypothetical protein
MLSSSNNDWGDMSLDDFDFDAVEVVPTQGYLAMPETGASTCCCESCCSSTSGSSIFAADVPTF